MRLIAVVAFAAGSALAQVPTDFRSSAPVTTTGADALQRFTLPLEAYRDAKPDLSDVRVFNAAGEAMPMAFASEPEATKETPPTVAMPTFPLFAPPRGREERPLDIRVKSGPGGTIVSISGNRPHPGAGRGPISWLVDVTQVKDPIRNLVIDWNTGQGTEVVRVSVEASDDLRAWRQVATRAPLLRVEQGGQQIAQRKVEVGSLVTKYLRIAGEPDVFALKSIEAEPAPVVRPAKRKVVTITGNPGSKPGEYVFDAGARLPVEALRLVLGPNSIAPVIVSTRESEKAPVTWAASATFYRLSREGVDVQSPAIDIGRRAARHWIVQLDSRSPPLGAPPSLELQWRPAQLVFVARGEGAFALAFGDPETKSAALSVAQLVPRYEKNAEMKLPEAKVGEVRSGERSHEWLRTFTAGTNPKRMVLWAILVIAVIVLGVMAWRLSRQIAASPPPPPSS